LFAVAWPESPASADTFTFWRALHGHARDRWIARLRSATLIPWRAADGRELLFTEWRGNEVSLLTARADYDPVLVQQLLNAFDTYWVRCREICGDTPPPDPVKGVLVGHRVIIAEITAPEDSRETRTPPPVTSAAGVARVSIGTDVIEDLLRRFRANERAAHAPLGDRLPQPIARSFVFFHAELGAATPRDFTPLADALAYLLAGQACDSLQWSMPPDPRPLESLLERYEQDPAANYRGCLQNEEGHLDADPEALWTAMLLRLRHASARQDFVAKLWRTLTECPSTDDPFTGVGNIVVAVSAAARSDQSATMRAWKFPIDEATAERVRQALAPNKLDVTPRQ